jgi:hypothetical protein
MNEHGYSPVFTKQSKTKQKTSSKLDGLQATNCSICDLVDGRIYSHFTPHLHLYPLLTCESGHLPQVFPFAHTY